MRKIILSLFLSLFVFGSQAGFAEPIDINTASVEVLTELKGVGPAKARAIVSYREQYGPFISVGQLAEVRGIGQKFIEQNGANITVSTPE